MAGSQRIGIGSAVNRVDGIAKVTGQGRYAAEHPAPDLLHGVVVGSTIAKGLIPATDEAAARAVPGVVEIVSHNNRPHIAWFDKSYRDDVAPPGSPLRPLYDDIVQYSGQPIALVLAETFEAARYAASLVQVNYAVETHNTDFEVALGERFMPRKPRDIYQPVETRGDV